MLSRCELVALALFLVTVLAGFSGSDNPYRNIAPTLVWIIWWVGFAYVSAFVGDIWALINPWRTMFAAAERALPNRPRRAFARAALSGAARRLAGVLLLLGFSWIELVYPNPAVPLHLAWLAVGYSVLTFAGMMLFGRETWLRHGEVFTVVFGTFARFAPTRSARRPAAAAAAAAVRRRAARQRLRLQLDDGVRVAAARDRAVRRRFDLARMDEARRRAAAQLSLLGELAPMVVRTAGLVAFWLVLSAPISASARS